MGVESIDLTVRPGGHVDPEHVETQLPQAAEILQQQGVSIGMITTNITDGDSQAERILNTAVSLGIQYYKIGYFPYTGIGTLRQERDLVKSRVETLATLNTSIGIHGGYHNHSSGFIGASLWDIDYILKDTDPRYLGIYFDPAHATIEGGSRGWEMALDLVRDRITMLAVKDFLWEPKPPGIQGARKFGLRIYPLEQGNTEWPRILHLLKRTGFHGPISLHSEYQGEASFKDLSVDEVFQQTARDLQQFHQWWNAGE